MAPSDNEYMPLNEATVLDNEDKRTIKSLAKEGILESHTLGDLLYIKRSSLEYYIQKRSCSSPKSVMTRRAFMVLGKLSHEHFLHFS